MAIFLSYSSRNQEQAARLAEILRTFDKEIFLEQKSLGGSTSWEQVYGRIRNCDLFVLALTQYSLNSYARQLEIDYALRLKKPMLMAILEDVGALPSELADVPKVIFRENYEPSVTVFSDAIRRVSPPQSQMTDAAPPRWSAALKDLQQRTETPNLPLYEQRRLSTSLRDMLERRETFAPTVTMLKQMLSDRSGDTQLIEEFGHLLEDAQAKTGWRNPLRLVALIAPVVIGVALLILLITRLLPFTAGVQETPTSVSSVMTLTAESATLIANTSTDESTETATFGPSATPTTSPTITLTPSETPVPPTVTLVQAFFPTRSVTPTPTATATMTLTNMPLPTETPTATLTFTATETLAAPSLPTEVATETPVPTDIATATEIFSETPTETPVPTETATATATATETLTETPLPTATPTATLIPTETPTNTPTFTFTPLPTETETPLPTETPTPLPTETPTATQTFTETPLPTVTLTATLPTSVYVGMRVEDSGGGVRVIEVGAAAQLAGVRVDDLVLAVDETPVNNAVEYQNAMNERRPIEVVTLRLRRGSGLVFATISLSITDFAIPTATPQISLTPLFTAIP